MQFLPDGLLPLARYKQFLVYHATPNPDHIGKTVKLPVHHLRGFKINPLDPANWIDVEQAIESAKLWGDGYGVGFAFTENDPFWFLDIDDCVTPMGWSTLAISLMTTLNGAAVEISQSGRGLHIFGTGQCPPHGCAYSEGDKKLLEFYTQKRFVALTGNGVVGNAATDCSAVLPWLVTKYFSASSSVTSQGDVMQRWARALLEPTHPDWSGPADNESLMRMMMASESAESALGDKPTLRSIWENTAQAQAYYHNDRNSLDAALAQLLTYWTGNNAQRMHDLMLQSKLVRDKYERSDYLPRTILFARDHATAFLKLKAAPPPVIAAAEGIGRGKTIQGTTFLTPDQQKEHFAGCTYVMDAHKILVPGGDLLRPDQFKAHKGRRSFAMDGANEKVTRNAWEAFTESQANEYEEAHSTCFRPDQTPGAVIPKNGRKLANTWWPVSVPRVKGDVTLFTNHLAKLWPDERDRLIVLCYMAAIVQYKGIKFQWAPLIQGTEQNGKTLLITCVAKAVGFPHFHLPSASELTEKYNDWLYGTIFIGVEEIYVPDARREVLEILKPWITGKELEIRAMYAGKTMKEVCCNFMFVTNHKDGLRKAQGDTRIAPFFCAQQSREDLIRDGMTREYFVELYGWLEAKNGYAMVAEFLHTFKIPDEFNPCNKDRAPQTSSTIEAIEHGMGGIEQEILEAVEQEQVGFRGGWISSIFLDRLLQNLKAERRIPRNRRRDLLKALGYIWHPALSNGRVNNRIDLDCGKPKLFILASHPSVKITNAADAVKVYIDAQQIV